MCKRYPDHLIFADVFNLEEAIYAADLLVTTLYGYIQESDYIDGSDFRIDAAMVRTLKV